MIVKFNFHAILISALFISPSTAFLFYRGRVFVYLSRSEAECRLVSLSNTIFNVNKSIHVQLAVNYFNSSGQFTHEAAVTWTEDVSAAKFRICVLTAGRLDRLPPDSGLTYVDFIAYQGNPVGSVTGHESLVSWWDGTSCQEIVLPQVCYSGYQAQFLTPFLKCTCMNFTLVCAPSGRNK